MKNKHPFTIGGSVSLKKALLEETVLHTDNLCFAFRVKDYTELGDNSLIIYPPEDEESDWFLSFDESQLPTHYQLPQDWDKAVAAVKDFFAVEPKFEVGKWYYAKVCDSEYLLRFSDIAFEHIYCNEQVFMENGRIEYSSERKSTCNINSLMADCMKPATIEQIQFMLGKVAEQKGFVKGAKVKCLLDDCNEILGGKYVTYHEKSNNLYASTKDGESEALIYNDGAWAELLLQKPKSGDVKTEHVRDFVKEWMEGHESDTFIANEHGTYMYSAEPTSINLVSFFEELVVDYIDYNPQPQAIEAKPETLVLKGVKVKLPYTEQKCTIELDAILLQQIKEYGSVKDKSGF
jgi:hypothetical protein